MADSYLDLEGPITMLAKFDVKPEFVDKFAQICKEYVERIRGGDHPYESSIESVRYENIFVVWSKLPSAEAAGCAFREGKDIFFGPINEYMAEMPEFKFFATNSITG